uniref:Ferrous iron transport protein A n=1 Tax=Staphylothermus marinus TaxID=2280 RepID=A0A7C4JM04_STAMA
MKTLDQAEAGSRVRIVRVEEKGELTWRLALMGLTKNTILEVIHNDRKGPLIVSINGSKIAIGRKIASSILVEDIR